ncbi:NeuD/PglB/VioB family sugar acetyltransferase [Solwaraspora sp. WMMB335]|uniref:NeuD/PglB/VioB family sugar acetyltransferase n=1 Tax=Solwaraspora sp. WMMB335 TaxID=3404118 RepID=UPI003B933D59
MPAGPSLSGLVLLGTSGHAREILAIAEAAGDYKIIGCTGPRRDADLAVLPVPWLGDDGWWQQQASPGPRYLIGIGAGPVRARVDARLRAVPARLVHPAAVVCRGADLGPGTVLWPGAILMSDVRTGRHVHVDANASVGHDTVLDDYATLLPASTVAGGARIGCAATIGAGATVIDGISVGAGAVVGAGATVIHDVPPQIVVAGVPARPLTGTR